MATSKFETSDTPHITLDECGGDLRIMGSGIRQVLIEADGREDDLIVQREGEDITVTARRDCSIICPPGATLTLRQVRGNLHVRGADGPLAIEAVMGEATLHGVGPVAIRTLHGDLKARDVKGDLTLGQVNGDARIRQVEGKLAVERCNGDLRARTLVGGADARNVLGDIRLESGFTPGKEYRLRAHGDAKVSVLSSSDARYTFEAAGRVHCDMELSESEVTPQCVTGRTGTGEATVELHADGDVFVNNADMDADIGVDVHIEAHLADMERRLQEKLASLDSIGIRVGDKMRQQLEKEAERARHQAEKAAERARRHAEREAERARRKVTEGRRTTGFGFTWSSPRESERTPAAEPPSDEERLTILRMLEQKKISASEASLLLEALEGRTQ